MIEFQLSDYDKSTLLWARLKVHLEERLTEARRRNDAPLTEQETAMLRGEIKSLRRLLALGEDRPPLTGE